jgi:hypothetical protein
MVEEKKKKMEEDDEKDVVDAEDVITDDLKELEEKLDDLSDKQQEDGGLSSGGKFKYVGPSAADGVMGFATYLSGVKTFRAGTRGDSAKLLDLATKFCDAMGFGTTSDDFPDNIKFPGEEEKTLKTT